MHAYLEKTILVLKAYLSWQLHSLSILGSFYMVLKSIHFKKPAAIILFLSKLWYFQYKSKQKVHTTILKETRVAQLSSENERTLADPLFSSYSGPIFL